MPVRLRFFQWRFFAKMHAPPDFVTVNSYITRSLDSQAHTAARPFYHFYFNGSINNNALTFATAQCQHICALSMRTIPLIPVIRHGRRKPPPQPFACLGAKPPYLFPGKPPRLLAEATKLYTGTQNRACRYLKALRRGVTISPDRAESGYYWPKIHAQNAFNSWQKLPRTAAPPGPRGNGS